MDTKLCTRCEKVKPIAEFYKGLGTRDGHLGQCKVCRIEYQKQYYRRTKLARDEYERKRAATTERRARGTVAAREHREKYPERYRARSAVGHAIREGKLIRPEVCPVCKVPGRKVEAHHEDYSKPLDVQWACRRCHRRIEGRSVT